MKNRLHTLYFLITFLLCIFFAALMHPPEASCEDFNKSILYINSYHNGYEWSDSILDGIRSELNSSWYKISFQIEYMDTKKFKSDMVSADLLNLYKEKFKNTSFDVVIISDDDAFNFALQYRSELFPDVPIVFCGVNNLTIEQEKEGNLTGVVENFDLAGTIDVALKLHPDKKRMIVVGDDSTTSNAILERIKKIVPRYSDRLEVEYWLHLGLDEVKNKVKYLNDESFLFFIPYYQVIGDHFYTSEEVVSAIYSNSNVPIYSSWEFLLGHGLVGGSFLSGYQHGQDAALLAINILEGKKISQLPIHAQTTGQYLFDYRVMKRLSLNSKMLPPGSKLINEPDPFYTLSHELFWTIMVSVLLLLVTILSLIFNMGARRQGERKIQNQLTFQETLIDTIPQLVSWKDIEGRYMGANSTYISFFGLEEIVEVVGKRTKEVIIDNDYVNWSVGADKAVIDDNKEFRRVRREISGISDTISWLEVNKVALRDQDGEINGILTTAENVTREENLEHQLLQSQKMEAIGTLAGGIAHDFNNILTSIINSTELAIGDVLPESQTEKDLKRVLKAARRGGDVVKQILAFSRPPKDGFRSTDFPAVIAEVISLMEVSLPGNIHVTAEIEPGIPEIHADPTQVHQALMNLCTNAFHALRDKGGNLLLKLQQILFDGEEASYRNLVPGEYIKLSVIDDGIGIRHEIIDKIFDPFFSSKDKTEGTGLGLAVVHGIMKGHGGGVQVKCEFGERTTFDLYFPKVILTQTISIPVPAQLLRGRANILFVEDDIDQLQSASRLLEKYGYNVLAMNDSDEAAVVIAEGGADFDLLITDYDMPGLNGVELVEVVNSVKPDLPVIMISGREEAIESASKHSIVKDILKKPYDKEELHSMINRVLRGTDVQ